MRDPLIIDTDKYRGYGGYRYYGFDPSKKPESGILWKDVEKFCSKHNNLDLLCMFPEDIPDKPNEVLCFPDGQSGHILAMTKKECLDEQKKIGIFLQNHLQNPISNPTSPQNKKIKLEQ